MRKCKICKGTGKIDRPCWDISYPNNGRDYDCDSCNGSGIKITSKWFAHTLIIMVAAIAFVVVLHHFFPYILSAISK